MESLKRRWKGVPHPIRKPITLVVGIFFILAAIATGWLPGPGGIPLFLIGIAILATEFTWAERIRGIIMQFLEPVFRWFRANKVLGVSIIVAIVLAGLALTYRLYFS